MSVAHLIARLSAGTANFKPVGRGGLPEFTDADIALAVGRISNPAAQLLVLMKYAGQDAPAVVQETVRLLTVQVMTRWATPERWGVPRGKGDSDDQTGRQCLEARIERMVGLAVDEVLNPRRCKRCNGRGSVQQRRADGSGLELRPCERCGCVGGQTKYPVAVRAKRCGIPGFYRSVWSDRYERILRRVNGLIAQGLDEVSRALG